MSLDPGWTDTVLRAKSDPRWIEYDPVIREEITAYNRRFASTPGYIAVDWRWIKAMLWVETGGPDAEGGKPWKERPMQIGNPGDPGFGTLRNRAEGADLIMSDALYGILFQSCLVPEYAGKANVRAGIAYLFTRMAKTELRSVINPADSRTYTHSVTKGETYESIAKSEGTTVQDLEAANPLISPKNLRIGATLQFHHAQTKRVIIGWRPFNAQTIAERYNVGDRNYSAKLDFIWKSIFMQDAPIGSTPPAQFVFPSVP